MERKILKNKLGGEKLVKLLIGITVFLVLLLFSNINLAYENIDVEDGGISISKTGGYGYENWSVPHYKGPVYINGIIPWWREYQVWYLGVNNNYQYGELVKTLEGNWPTVSEYYSNKGDGLYMVWDCKDNTWSTGAIVDSKEPVIETEIVEETATEIKVKINVTDENNRDIQTLHRVYTDPSSGYDYKGMELVGFPQTLTFPKHTSESVITYTVGIYAEDFAGNKSDALIRIGKADKPETEQGPIEEPEPDINQEQPNTPPDICYPEASVGYLNEGFAKGSIFTNSEVVIKGTATDIAYGDKGIYAYMFSTDPNLTARSKGWNRYTQGAQSKIEEMHTVTQNCTVYFYVLDYAGHMKKVSFEVNCIDNEEPTIEEKGTTEEWTNKHQTVKVELTDDRSGIYAYMFTQDAEIKEDSSGWTLAEKNKDQNGKETFKKEIKDLKFEADKNGVWYLYVKDASGNMNKMSFTIKNVDTEAPYILNYDQSTKMKVLAKDSKVSIKIVDNGSGLAGMQITKSLKPDSTKWVTITGNRYEGTQPITENGNYYIHVKDVVGNISSGLHCLTIDNIVETLEDTTKKIDISKLNDIYVNEPFIPTTTKTNVKGVVLDGKTTGKTYGYWLGLPCEAGEIENYNKDNYPVPELYGENKIWYNLKNNGAIHARFAMRVAHLLEDGETIQAIACDVDGDGLVTYDLDSKFLLQSSTGQHNNFLEETKNRKDIFAKIEAEGNYELIVTTYNSGDFLQDVYKFTIDKTKPEVELDIKLNENDEIVFVGSAKDEISNIVAYQFSKGEIDESKWVTVDKVAKEFIAEHKLEENIENMFFYAKDSAGNIESSNILNISANNEEEDLKSPEILKLETINSQLDPTIDDKTDSTTYKSILIKAIDNYGIVGYIFSKDGNLNENSEEWKDKVIEETKNFSETFEVIEGEEWYFYVKDKAGNYAVRSLSGQNERDTQKPAITVVIQSGEENVNDKETLRVLATDFENGSGIDSISISREKGKYDWQQALQNEKVRNEEFKLEVTENGFWYIYIKDKAGNISQPKEIEIENIVTKVDPEKITLKYNEKIRIGTKAQPTIENAEKAKSIEYSSSNRNIAKVDANGVVLGVNKGTAEITALIRNYDGTTVTKKCNVNILDRAVKIIEEPADKNVFSKEPVKLNVGVEEGTNATYQWYKTSENNVTTGKAIEGETQGLLTLNANTVEANGYYYCKVTNNSDSLTEPTVITTRPAKVTVYTTPDELQITAVDKEGNEIQSGESTTSELTITVKSNVAIQGAGNIAYKYSYDKKNWQEYESQIKFTEETNGTELYVKAYNTENTNLQSEIAVFNIKIDKTAPTIVLKQDGGKYVKPRENGRITCEIGVDEEVDKIEYAWSTSKTVPTEGWETKETQNVTVGIADPSTGIWYLHVKATDKAGNEATLVSKEFQVLESKIIITKEKVEGKVIITIEYGEGLTENRVVKFNNEVIENTQRIEVLENGILYAEATDKAGNKVFETIEINEINDKKDLTIESDKYLIETEEKSISKVQIGNTIENLKLNFTTNATKVTIKNARGEELKDTDRVFTGMQVEITLDGEKQTYEVAVEGDCTGDGLINVLDLIGAVKQYKHVKSGGEKGEELEAIKLKAIKFTSSIQYSVIDLINQVKLFKNSVK